MMARRWLPLMLAMMLVAVAGQAAAGNTTAHDVTASQPRPGADVNAIGVPSGGTAPDGSVRGFFDAHSHLFAHVSFGGNLICGKVFDSGGPDEALVDCLDHYPNGMFAWFENFTRYGTPFGTHDPVGWPTFNDWPAHNSLTHQGAYFKWIERAWRGGLRLMVNHLVANRQLCEIYPIKTRPCGEMRSIRLQAQLTYQLEEFIDARNGGPGEGWFRVVTSAEQARQVIKEGKLAVILGVETSEPFGCRVIRGNAQCTKADIEHGLDKLYDMGVRTMFLCHKYNNALCGVRFDSGPQGMFVNAGNFLSTGKFWETEPCAGKLTDNTISPNGRLPGVIAKLVPPLPVYPPGPHCNVKGLTDLGEFMVRQMMERNMIIELDHMSVEAADETLSILEQADYPGVISSHSWSDKDLFPRIYQLGGMVAQYGHTSTQFVQEWRRSEQYRDAHGVSGYAFGIDVNGIGGLPAPRENNADNPVTYPFTSFDGSVTLYKLTTGQRTWDYNKVGMAHYGLMPDWIQDMRVIAGDEIVRDLANGAEAYLRTLSAAQSW